MENEKRYRVIFWKKKKQNNVNNKKKKQQQKLFAHAQKREALGSEKNNNRV